MAYPVLPSELLDIILDHLLLEQDCLPRLSLTLSTRKALRPLGWEADIYHDGLWRRVGRNAPAAPTGIYAFVSLNRHWRRRSLAVIMQRLSVSDNVLSSKQGDIEPLIKRLSATAALADGLSALEHVKHLTYGWNVEITEGGWFYDIESHPWLTSKRDKLGQEWSLDKEIELGASLFDLLPTKLCSLCWCSPLPIEGKIAERLEKIQFVDVSILSNSYYAAPRNLKVFNHARRLSLIIHAGKTVDQEHTDNFYEDRGDPSSRNLLAEYLLNDAPHLESLETNWCPIFSVKECLPRFACLSLYYAIERWRFSADNHPLAVTPEFSDHSLQRNACRLRGALRRYVLDSCANKISNKSVALTASDVMALCRRQPFEEGDTWTAWLSDASLMEQVALAFNSCSWALHDDIPPNPASRNYANFARDDWPLSPYVKAEIDDQ